MSKAIYLFMVWYFKSNTLCYGFCSSKWNTLTWLWSIVRWSIPFIWCIILSQWWVVSLSWHILLIMIVRSSVNICLCLNFTLIWWVLSVHVLRHLDTRFWSLGSALYGGVLGFRILGTDIMPLFLWIVSNSCYLMVRVSLRRIVVGTSWLVSHFRSLDSTGVDCVVDKNWSLNNNLFSSGSLSDSLLNLNLRSPDDIVDLVSNGLDLLLSIETFSNLLIRFNEWFELLLKAVVLVIEVGHVLVECLNLSLKVNLILHHLLWVSLESIDLVWEGLFILLLLRAGDLKFLESDLTLLTGWVLVFVSFEKLGLGSLVLLSLTFEVSQLTVEFVQSVFVLRNELVGFIDLRTESRDLILLVNNECLNIVDSLVVIFYFSSKNWNSLGLVVKILVEVNWYFSHLREVLVILMTDFLLLDKEGIGVANLLSEAQVGLICDGNLLSEGAELAWTCHDVSLVDGYSFKKSYLLFLNLMVFNLQSIELSDESIDLNSILTNSSKALILESLFLYLNLLILLRQVRVLLLESTIISLFILEICDFRLQISNEKLMMLRDDSHLFNFPINSSSLLSGRSLFQTMSRHILALSCLLSKAIVLHDWGSWSILVVGLEILLFHLGIHHKLFLSEVIGIAKWMVCVVMAFDIIHLSVLSGFVL